jgi:hypothetical protein
MKIFFVYYPNWIQFGECDIQSNRLSSWGFRSESCTLFKAVMHFCPHIPQLFFRSEWNSTRDLHIVLLNICEFLKSRRGEGLSLRVDGDEINWRNYWGTAVHLQRKEGLCKFCMVRRGVQNVQSCYSRDGLCLLCGTNWIFNPLERKRICFI